MSGSGERGLTLIELMVWCVLTVIFAGLCATVTRHVWQSGRTSADYVADLSSCRGALQALEADLRQAARTEVWKAGFRIHGDGEPVDYMLVEGVLHRSIGKASRVVGRRISRFELESRGALVDVRLGIMKRSATARNAEIHTSVFLRGAGAPASRRDK